MNQIAIFLGSILAALIVGFVIGINYEQGRQAGKIVEQLKDDNKIVEKIKAKEDKRHAKNQAIIFKSKIDIPLDDFNHVISDAAIKRLCEFDPNACP